MILDSFACVDVRIDERIVVVLYAVADALHFVCELLTEFSPL
jgi:hypothetical protein